MKYRNVINLFSASHKAATPLLLFYVVGAFILNVAFDLHYTFAQLYPYLLFKSACIHTPFFLFCLLLVVRACYEAQQKRAVNYIDIFIKSIGKLISLIISIIPVTLAACIFVMFGAICLAYTMSSFTGILDLSFFILCETTLFLVALFIFGPTFLLSIYLIAIKDNGPLVTIKECRSLLENNTHRYFMLFLGLVIFKLLLIGLYCYIRPFVAAETMMLMINYVWLPLLACVIVACQPK